MELPKGFEAYVLPRSSTPNKWNIELANSQGVIDESYKGMMMNGNILLKHLKLWKFQRVLEFVNLDYA